jgi:hepatocyte growth factor-regulated tyrosine kinase substrate
VGASSTRSARPRPSLFLISVSHRRYESATRVTRTSRGTGTRCKLSLYAARRQAYASATPNGRHRRSSHGPSHVEHRSARDLPDADLQRAIQLSLGEVNAQGQHSRPGYVPYQPDSWQQSEPPLVEHTLRASAQADDDDSDLKAAIEASLREANAPKPSAPIDPETPRAEGPSISYAGSGSQSYFPAASAQPSLPSLPSHDLAPLESDTIMTFSQTIEQVQAQGGRDVSRSPAVAQLFDNANNLRPKLARSLDDAGRKEGTLTFVFYCLIALDPSMVPSELLTEMNDKLAQAVKLYDHILTQQVSRPIWRQQTASAPAQPFNQWNYVRSPTSTQPTHTPMAEPLHQPSSTYTSPQAYQPPASDGPSHIAPSYSPPQTWTQPSHVPSVASPPPIDASQVNPQYQSVPTTQSSVYQQYQYAHPVQLVSVQQPHPPGRAPAQGPSPQQTETVATHTTPVHHHISSPPFAQHRQQSLPQPQQPLPRHNTVTHAAQASPAPSQQQYSATPAIGLPTFPSVPTAPPSIPYGSASTVVEQPKKEALLIEL